MLYACLKCDCVSLYPNASFHYIYYCIYRENIATVKKWREAVGPDFPLMIDCYMSLTLPYSIELARRCEPYNVKWIEEALPPDDYEGYSELKKAVRSTLITTGEHEVSIIHLSLLFLALVSDLKSCFYSTQYTREYRQLCIAQCLPSCILICRIFTCISTIKDMDSERFLRRNARTFYSPM